MAVDGGPRAQAQRYLRIFNAQVQGPNPNGNGNGNAPAQNVVTRQHDHAKYRAYYKFFSSAGKMIFYDRMAFPTTRKFTLSSLVCTHPHEDHVEGLLDLLQQAGETMDPGIGFILPGLSQTRSNHLDEVYRILVQGGPKMVPTRLDRNQFVGGVIDYPPESPITPLDPTSPIDPIILLRPRTGQDMGVMTLELFKGMFKDVSTYVKSLNGTEDIYKAVNLKTKNNLNLASILMHIKGISGGGIYLTGDNNGNLIHHYISAGTQAPSFVKHIQNSWITWRRQHYAIYKISHHGGSEDSQINVGTYRYEQLDKRAEEFAVFGTLSLDYPNETPAYCAEMLNAHKSLLKILVRELWKILQLPMPANHPVAAAQVIEKRKEYFTTLKKRNAEFCTGLKMRTRLPNHLHPSLAWHKLIKKLNALEDRIETDPAAKELYTSFFFTQRFCVKSTKAVEIQWMTKKWWRKWWGGYVSNYPNPGMSKETGIFDQVVRDVTRTVSSRAFFASFTADAYVVSSNASPHPHPHAATLVGLAWALKNEHRFATLYLTSAFSFREDYFTSHAERCGQVPSDLWEFLDIRYPTDDVYFSLTAEPEQQRYINGTLEKLVRNPHGSLGWPKADSAQELVFASALHDYNKVTRSMVLPRSQDVKNEDARRHKLMEDHTRWHTIERTMATVFYIKSTHASAFKSPQGWIKTKGDSLKFVNQAQGQIADKSLRVRIRSTQKPPSLIHKDATSFTVSNDDYSNFFNDPIQITLFPVSRKPYDQTYYIRWQTKQNVQDNEWSRFAPCGKNVEIVSFKPEKELRLQIPFEITAVPDHYQVAAIMQAPVIMPRLNTVFPIRQNGIDEDGGIATERVTEINEEPVEERALFQEAAEEAAEDAQSMASTTKAPEVSAEYTIQEPILEPRYLPFTAASIAEQFIATAEPVTEETPTEKHEEPPTEEHEEPRTGAGAASGGDDDEETADTDLDPAMDDSETAMPVVRFRERNDGKITTIAKNHTLKDYLASRASDSPSRPTMPVNTAIDFLTEILPANDLESLRLRPHERNLLSLPIDQTVSTVDFTTDALAVTVQGAVLQLTASETTTLDIGGTSNRVVHVEAQFSCGVDEDMDLYIYVGTAQQSPDRLLEEQNSMLIRKHLHRSAQDTLLLKIVSALASEAGITEAEVTKMDIVDALAIIVANDRTAISMFYERIPFALSGLLSFMTAKPDWSQSTGQAAYNALQNIDIKQAIIIFDLASIGTATSFTIGPLSVSLSSVRIEVLNARRSTQEVSLIASASFIMNGKALSTGEEDIKVEDGVNGGLQLSIDALMKVALHSGGPNGEIETVFLLGKAASFSDVLKSLGRTTKASELDSIAVPLTNSKGTGISTENNQAMDKLKLKPGTFGFVLRQPLMNPCQPDYILDRVFASVDLADWQEWLPVKFPRAIKNGSVIIQVDVIDPFNPKRRRVRVDVDFILQLRIGSGATDSEADTREIRTSLSAIPLVAPGDHEYRIDLGIAKSYEPLSLLELTSAIGLGDVIDTATQEVPLLHGILDTVRVRSLSAGISPSSSGQGWEFSDWSAEVDIAGFDLIPGKIGLRDVVILLQQKTMITQEISASVVGNIALFVPTKGHEIVDPEKGFIDPTTYVAVDLRTPTRSTGGQMWLQIPNGVSTQDMLDVFNLGNFNDIPVIGQMLGTQLKKMGLCTFPYASSGETLAMKSFEIELYHEKLVLGPMAFTHLDVSFQWIAPNVTGDTSSIATHVHVSFLDQDVLGELVYIRSAEERRFGASLVPTSWSENRASIGRMLRACLPSALPGLDILGSVVDSLMLQRAEIGFASIDNDTGASQELKLSYFDFHVLDATPLEVQKVVLRELRVIYRNEEVKASEHPESLPQDETLLQDLTKPRQTSLSVLAVLEKDSMHGDIKARIEVFAKSEGDVKTIAFSLLPEEQNSLTVSNLLSLFSFSDDALRYPHPEECPAILSIVIDVLAGELSNADDQAERQPAEPGETDGKEPDTHDVDNTKPTDAVAKKALKIRKFGFAAHTGTDIKVVKSPPILIKDVVLHIVYDGTKVVEPPSSNLNGILKGKIIIRGLVVEAAFGFDGKTGAWVFAAEAPLTDILSHPDNKVSDASATTPTGVLDLASSTGMDAAAILDLESTKMKSVIIPNTLGARIRLTRPRQIDVWALGDDVWEGNVCGVVLRLEKIGVFFRYTEGPLSGAQLTRDEPVCEGYVSGRLNFKGWVADACMSIGPQRNAVLTAKLRKETSSTESNDLNLFKESVDDVATNGDAGSWSDLVTAFKGASYKISDSQAALFADLKRQKLIISASLEGLGSALLLSLLVAEEGPDAAAGKKMRRSYVFLLEVQRLSQLWSSMDSDVDSQFDIRRISVQIFGYKTSMAELRKELEDLNQTEPDYNFLDQPAAAVDLDTDMASATNKAEGINNQATEPFDGTQATGTQKAGADTKSAATALQTLKDLPERDLEPGAWFFAELSLGRAPGGDGTQGMRAGQQPQGMTDVILLDAKAGQDSARARLYALVPKKESTTGSQIEYGIDIQNLRFFDNIMTINGNGKYLPSTRALKLTALLSLKLDTQDSQTLDLGVTLDLDKQRTAFSARVDYESNQVVSNPFRGSMFNVTLASLSIDGSSTRKADGSGVMRQCTIRGVATLGSKQDNKLLCMIHFADSKPAVVVVEFGQKVIDDSTGGEVQDPTAQQQNLTTEKIDATVSVSDIFQQIIEPKQSSSEQQTGSWPSDTVDDFVLKEAFLSYNNTDKTIFVGERAYVPGFYAYGAFDLFEMPISVSILIDKSRKGVLIAGSYAHVIDLGLLKLTAFQSTDGKVNVNGLTLTVDTRDQTDGIKFAVSSGLTLLDMPGFFFAVAYRPNKDPNKREFSGTAMYKGEALGGFLEDPGIEFSYKHGRWSMTNLQLRRDATWDAKNPTGGLPFDLDKALQMGSHGGDCKDLADFVVGELLQMKFTFTLGLPNMKQSDMKAVTSSEATPEANEQANKDPNVERNENKEGFTFMVTWWIDVTIAGYNAGKVKLDDFNFTVSFKGFRATFEGLLTFLWEQVLSDKNMAEVGRKILTNPEVLGKLLTKVALEKLTDEIVERLLCRKPEQPKDKENLKERTKKIQDNTKKDMDDKVDDAKKDLDKVKDGSKPSSGGGGSGGGGGGLPIPPIILIPQSLRLSPFLFRSPCRSQYLPFHRYHPVTRSQSRIGTFRSLISFDST